MTTTSETSKPAAPAAAPAAPRVRRPRPQLMTVTPLAADRIKTMTGGRSEIVRIPYDEAYEAGFEDMPRRVPDISKINALVGYTPTVDLDEILERVVEFSRQR